MNIRSEYGQLLKTNFGKKLCRNLNKSAGNCQSFTFCKHRNRETGESHDRN